MSVEDACGVCGLWVPVPVHRFGGQSRKLGIHLCHSPYYFLETGSPEEAWNETGSQEAKVIHSSVLSTTLGFYMGAKDSNPCPCACTSSTLTSSATSPAQSTKVLKSFSQNPIMQDLPLLVGYSSDGFTKWWHYLVGGGCGGCSWKVVLPLVSHSLLLGHGRWGVSSTYSHHHNVLPYHGLETTKAHLRLRLPKLWTRIRPSFCKAICSTFAVVRLAQHSTLGFFKKSPWEGKRGWPRKGCLGERC